MFFRLRLPLLFVLSFLLGTAPRAAEFKVGRASRDMTPSRPIALDGQMHTRISKKVATPITANIIAMEGGLDGKASRAIVVSLDLVSIREVLGAAIREAVKKAMPEFDVDDLVLSATHTHTSGVVLDDKYHVPEGTDYMLPSGFAAFVAEKVADGAKEAWEGRRPARFSYGLGFAAVACCRRTVYANGTAVMYGNTNDPNFRRMESMEDHDVGTMFFGDDTGKLIAMIVNLSCPSQAVEGLHEIHADFWDPARKMIREKYGKDVTVVAWTGAAGEQSPHTMYRKAAEERMRRLRGLSPIDEIARRIVRAVDEAYEAARKDWKTDVPFRHEYEMLRLPMHEISETEYESLKKQAGKIKSRLADEPGLSRTHDWIQGAVDRHENLKKGVNTDVSVPVHVLRIGGAAAMTNPFELFGAYGIQMKAQCKATQTFVVQLTDSPVGFPGGYLPTAEAYKHGGYSAIPQSVRVGPEGGRMLVEESLRMANGLFQ